MPDADPQDTTAYAERVLDRLRSSAPRVVLSYAAVAADRVQLPSALLQDLEVGEGMADPGWHAGDLRRRVALQHTDDRRATLRDGEMISGGARTINLQRTEPFAAFVAGQLDTFLLAPFTAGIAASVRGSLVHDSLFNLYADQPSQADITGWSEEAAERRVNNAIDAAFVRHERYADTVLRQLFRLERQRTAALLQRVIEHDRARQPFSVGTVERAVEGHLGPVAISLRCDRIDELPGGEVVILDYKTGTRRRFLRSGEPDDLQLVVYACVAEHRVSGLGFYNVDSAYLGIDGGGPALARTSDWEADLQRWQNEVLAAANGIARGDVRVNILQQAGDARPLALLSRIEELRRDN
jgi:RecB family exonuclease